MTPREQAYGILAYSTVAKQTETTITQEFALPVALVRIFVPDGMEVKGQALTSEETQDIQGTLYRSYRASDFEAGHDLTFEISGSPKGAETTSVSSPFPGNNSVLIGAVSLGILLIGAGVWMYLRDRRDTEEDLEDEQEEEEPEFESSEEVLDAIIALDDLHRAKKISSEAYQKRRAELKVILRGML